MFDPDQLRQMIQSRLNDNVAIPNGHKGAVFAYYDPTKNSAQGGFAFKTENGWQVQGDLTYMPHTEGLSAGVQLMKTW